MPVQTLRDRVKGHVDALNFGGETVFTHEEELTLVEHLETLAQLGYGATNSKLQHLAGDLAFALNKRPSSKPLSGNWLYGFLNRWEDRISSIRPRSLDTHRAKASTPEIVDTYFDNLKIVLEENDLEDKPQFIYNLDETGIHPEHRPPNVIAPKGQKTPAITSPRSTTTTLIGCANAAGHHLPPFFVFKGKRFNPDLMKGASPGAKGVMSDSGWSNAQIFREYIENHFLPNVRRGSNDNQPILLLYDGHSSHVSKQLIEWARTVNIILFVLPAHTSHLLQPLDVGIFGPFKRFYYGECASFMYKNMGKTITKYEMTEIACTAYLKAMSPSNIISSFNKSGIYPFNAGVVGKEKLFPSESFRDTTPVLKVAAIKSGREAVQQYLTDKLHAEQTNATKSKPNCCCKCTCQTDQPSEPPFKPVKKPTPGGKEITSNQFLNDISVYEEEKENVPKKISAKGKGKGKQLATKRKQKPLSSPKPSTSGENIVPMTDDESSDDDSEVCCVCNKFAPPTLHTKPYLKLVSWAQCTTCAHWVHLSFCTDKQVVRRGDTFNCPHCT